MAIPGGFVTAGQRVELLAEDFNGWQQAAKLAKGGTGGASAVSLSSRDSSTILIRQPEGFSRGVIERFQAVVPEEPAIDPADNLTDFQNTVVLNGRGATPTSWRTLAGQAYGRFAIAQEPITMNGGIGRCKINGITPVKIDFSDGLFDRADIDANSLKSAPPRLDRLYAHPAGSAMIIWREAADGSDGLRWAVVALNFGAWWTQPLPGVTNAAIAAGAFGDVTVMGMTMSCQNSWAMTAATSGVKCWVQWNPAIGFPSIVPFECG